LVSYVDKEVDKLVNALLKNAVEKPKRGRMNPERPFHLRNVRACPKKSKTCAYRLSLLPDMDRATLIAALDWPDCQPRVKSAIKRRLKQFDAWGHSVTVEYNNGKPSETLDIPAMPPQSAARPCINTTSPCCVIGDPITREAWIRAYGDGKTRCNETFHLITELGRPVAALIPQPLTPDKPAPSTP